MEEDNILIGQPVTSEEQQKLTGVPTLNSYPGEGTLVQPVDAIETSGHPTMLEMHDLS